MVQRCCRSRWSAADRYVVNHRIIESLSIGLPLNKNRQGNRQETDGCCSSPPPWAEAATDVVKSVSAVCNVGWSTGGAANHLLPYKLAMTEPPGCSTW